MVTKLMIRDDLVLGKYNGEDGIECPNRFKDTDINLLRYIDGQIINVSENRYWFIDESSSKHLINLNDWQALECGIHDQLLKEGDLWIVADTLYWDTQEARNQRNKLRSHVDQYTLPTATINDVPVSMEQQAEAVVKSHELAAWPSIEGWPYIPLPKLPDWMPLP